MFELVNIVKKFEDRTILDIPYLSFRENKRYVLMGVNGSGKTTLLRIMAGHWNRYGEVKNIPREEYGLHAAITLCFWFFGAQECRNGTSPIPPALKKPCVPLKRLGWMQCRRTRAYALRW
jgi:energy-coupling factor transporter ATP-binding protein EcfA2